MGDPGDPTPPSMRHRGAREGHLSPWVTPRGFGGAARGGVLGGGRGGHLPRGHHQLPRQLLALAALGSVWKAVLRELEGRGFTGHVPGVGQAHTSPEDSPACSWLQGPGRPRARASGAPPGTAPTRVQGGGKEGSGVQRENLAPSGVLEKLIPKDTQPWLYGP